MIALFVDTIITEMDLILLHCLKIVFFFEKKEEKWFWRLQSRRLKAHPKCYMLSWVLPNVIELHWFANLLNTPTSPITLFYEPTNSANSFLLLPISFTFVQKWRDFLCPSEISQDLSSSIEHHRGVSISGALCLVVLSSTDLYSFS